MRRRTKKNKKNREANKNQLRRKSRVSLQYKDGGNDQLENRDVSVPSP